MKQSDIAADSPTNHIKDWPCFFEAIREGPWGMWFGGRSLLALEFAIKGVHMAEILYDVPEDKRLAGSPFDEFEEWIHADLKSAPPSTTSFGLARRGTKSDEDAFDLWFSWYDRFRSEKSPTGPGHS